MRGDGRGTGGTVLCTVTGELQIPDAAANFDVSIPQSASRLPAPFTQGSLWGAKPEAPEESMRFPPHPPRCAQHLLLEGKASPYGDA